MPQIAPQPYKLIDTAPSNHTYTGGLLCNLQNPGAAQTPDYICGELTWDGATHTLNWYHWNGSDWTCSILSDECGIAVGMDAADLTGNGQADVVAVEWPLGPQAGQSAGNVYWFEQPQNPYQDRWTRHVLATGWSKAHDLLIGDIANRGRADVLVRLKDGRISWFSMPNDPRNLWAESLVTAAHPGDGTALYDVTGSGCLDIVTGSGFFENLDGAGQRWQFHPFQAAADLGLDPETRVVAGDILQDGSVAVVIAESEVLTNARLVLLHTTDGGKTWATHILIDAEADLGALHSLQLLDADNDGRLDIFTAEMELYVQDTNIVRRPTWKLLLNSGHLKFAEKTVLDANLGAHMGFAGKISRPDGTDFVAKNWSANAGNACGGSNHVVHVAGWTNT